MRRVETRKMLLQPRYDLINGKTSQRIVFPTVMHKSPMLVTNSIVVIFASWSVAAVHSLEQFITYCVDVVKWNAFPVAVKKLEKDGFSEHYAA